VAGKLHSGAAFLIARLQRMKSPLVALLLTFRFHRTQTVETLITSPAGSSSDQCCVAAGVCYAGHGSDTGVDPWSPHPTAGTVGS